MAVRWLYIQTVVVWGASLGGLDSIRRRADIEALVQFDRSIESFVVFVAWLFKWLSSSSGNGRLVLATVLSYLPAYLPICLPTYLPACLPACLCQCLIQFGGGVGPIEGSDWIKLFPIVVRWLYIYTVVVWGAS